MAEGNRTINVAAGATYIEKQENNFYDSSQQVWNDAQIESIGKQKETDVNTDENGLNVTLERKFYNAIKAVVDSGKVMYKYDYAACYKRMREIESQQKISMQYFVDTLNATKLIEDCLFVENIKPVILKGTFPDWKWPGEAIGKLNRLKQIGEIFGDNYK